jgi:hypothetical protein
VDGQVGHAPGGQVAGSPEFLGREARDALVRARPRLSSPGFVSDRSRSWLTPACSIRPHDRAVAYSLGRGRGCEAAPSSFITNYQPRAVDTNQRESA